jgi:hypothetical protein
MTEWGELIRGCLHELDAASGVRGRRIKNPFSAGSLSAFVRTCSFTSASLLS